MTHFCTVLVQVYLLICVLVIESATVSPLKAVESYSEEYGEAFVDSGLAAIFPSCLDLGSLNLENSKTTVASRKRRMINDSPESLFGFAHFPFSSENLSPQAVNFNHYSQPEEVQDADDDYFFFDTEKNYTRFELEEIKFLPGRAPKLVLPKNAKKNENELTDAPVPIQVRIDEFVVDGSEIIHKEEAAVKISSPVQQVKKRPRRDSIATTIFDRIGAMKDKVITLSLGNYLEPSENIQPKTSQELGEISSSARQPTTSSISDTIFGIIKPFCPPVFDLEAQGFYSQEADNANAEEDEKEEKEDHWSLLPNFDLETGNGNGNEYAGFF